MSITAEDEAWKDIDFDDPELQKLLDEPLPPQDNSRLRTNEQHVGFDSNVGDSWIYPSNLPCRAYQMSIAQAALYRNTLVVLPTGLGKTFIAAVVMYNMYRWYPTCKVIFMAPTRPLVAQQIEACQRIMPFPSSDTVELTGKLQRRMRAELWRTKRVFFATPQVVQSDIVADGVVDESSTAEKMCFPFGHVKLIVVDEAHKAKGRYAYAEVAQALYQRSRYFRVLALSATPGRTMEDVAEVVRNLYISHLEVRWESSIDVMPYVHKRTMKTVVVPLGDEIKSLREQLIEIIDPYLRQLIDAEVLSGSLSNISRNFLVFEQKRFRERSQQQRHPQQSAIASNFSICISLYHAVELLERHGLRVFLQNFEEDDEGRAKFVVNMDARLRDLLERVRTSVGPNPFNVSVHTMTNGKIAEVPKDLDFGHPKFEQARTVLLKHFDEHADSRAIVFCEYRESVMLIYRLLLQHAPLLKPRCFVGQGGTSGSLRALTQKQQIQIMSDFRSGKSNILVATSIGEEGIDVGEVEMIVCFDINTSNPTRFIQRIGRTGRQKQGNVVMLATEGREQQLLQDVLAHKDNTNKKLLRSSVVQAALYKHAPRLVPTEFNPQCVHTFVKPPPEELKEEAKKKETKKESKKEIKKLKEKTKKPIVSTSHDLRNFFKKLPILDGQSHSQLVEVARAADTQAPGLQTQQNTENRIKEFFKDLDVSKLATSNTQLLATQANVKACSLATTAHADVAGSPAAHAGPRHTLEASTHSTSPAAAQADVTRAEIDPRHVRKFNKFLRNPSLRHSESLPDDIPSQLKSKKLSKVSKSLLLKLQPDFVRQTYEQMTILGALELEKGTSNSKEEEEIRKLYEIIETVFDGKAALEMFLNDIQNQTEQNDGMSSESEGIEFNVDDDNDFENLTVLSDEDEYFEAAIDRIFSGLNEQGICNDNFDYVQEEVKKTQRYQMFLTKQTSEETPAQAETVAKSMVYDTMMLEDESTTTMGSNNVTTTEDNSTLVDTKNSSQWYEFVQHDFKNKSTPIQRGGTLDKAFKRQHQQQQKNKPTLLQRLDESYENEADSDSDVILIEEDIDAAEAASCKEKERLSLSGNCDKVIFKKTEAAANLSDCKLKNSELKTKDSKFSALQLSVEISSAKLDQTPTRHSTNLNNNKVNVSDKNELTPKELALPTEIRGKSPSKALETMRECTPPPLLPQKIVEDIREKAPSSAEKLLCELDIDMDAFMEPFPEELSCTAAAAAKQYDSSIHRLSSSLRDIFIEPFSEELICDAEAIKNHETVSALAALNRTLKSKSVAKQLESAAGVSTRTEPIKQSPHPYLKNFNQSKPYPEKMKPSTSSIVLIEPVSILTTQPSPSLLENFDYNNLASTFRDAKVPEITDNLIVAKPIEALAGPVNTNSVKTKLSLASKLSAKIVEGSILGTPPKALALSSKSPQGAVKKSPSLFDMYLNNMRGRSRIVRSQIKSSTGNTKPDANSNADDSDFVCVKRRTSKRKLIDSSDESDNEQNESVRKDDKHEASTTDCEQIASSPHHRKRKIRKLAHAFVEQEAAVVSGSDHSEDEVEVEESFGCYLKDSVIVSSDESDENDDVSAMQMQAIYLKSLKSPRPLRGAFKIPAPRVYNDHAQIYSQPAPIEHSQYVHDSFVVEEEQPQGEVSLCPLERAEKILKERRRAKRQLAKIGFVNSRRKRIAALDSSDDEK